LSCSSEDDSMMEQTMIEEPETEEPETEEPETEEPETEEPETEEPETEEPETEEPETEEPVNSLQFKGLVFPLTMATINVFSPSSDPTEIKGYELLLEGEINDLIHILRFEIYPPDSNQTDEELTFGTFNTGGTFGGFEGFIILNYNPSISSFGDSYFYNDSVNESVSILLNMDGTLTVNSDTNVSFFDSNFELMEIGMFSYSGPVIIN